MPARPAVLLLAITLFAGPGSAQETAPLNASASSQISLGERAFIASKIYAAIPIYFAHWQGTPGFDMDAAYRRYLGAALAAPDRFGFDIATEEFMAQLHNGHSGFFDAWLDRNYGQPLGFRAGYLQGQWVVMHSDVPGLKPGQVVSAINGTPFETFFQQHKQFIADSDDRTTRHSLFNYPELFPQHLTLTTVDGAKIVIDRTTQKGPSGRKTEGRWLQKGDVAYISIPSFNSPESQQAALDYVKLYKSARTLIIDVRGNGGGSTPDALVDALMDRPYRFWAEASPVNVGIFNERAREAQEGKNSPPDEQKGYLEAFTDIANHPNLYWPAVSHQPEHPVYKGKLLLLCDGGCFSACEDFLVPFKDNKRATLIGETTGGSSGQPFYYEFGNGMSFRISTKREFFPDGSPFEGVGIRPDVGVQPTAADIAAGRDAVLLRAMDLATH